MPFLKLSCKCRCLLTKLPSAVVKPFLHQMHLLCSKFFTTHCKRQKEKDELKVDLRLLAHKILEAVEAHSTLRSSQTVLTSK
eukprot:Skav234433  [mRNA]  locus=scaffold3409:42466:49643:- [translate_table: standard]